MIKKAHAKLNLAIDILGRREDGYHYVDMISVPLELHDCLQIYELNENYETFITADDVTLSCDRDNLVHRAINMMKENYNIHRSYRVEIFKMIPTQAGLAGGSADAACLIRTIAKSSKEKIDLNHLVDLSKSYGADIPYCIFEKTARVQGIGEKLEFIDDKLNFNVLIVKPKQGLATKDVFALYDKIGQSKKPDIDALYNLIKTNCSEKEIAPLLYNGLTETAKTLCSDIENIFKMFEELNLCAYEMSGSGSACYAFSNDRKKLEEAAKVFDKKGYKTFITKIYHSEK